jgi:hypothetical protein
MNPLDEDFRSDLRYFAFYLGNGTLIPKDADFDSVDYTDCAIQKDDTIGSTFAVYLNNKRRYPHKAGPYPAKERAAQWLVHRCDPAYQVIRPFEAWELEPASTEMTITDVIKAYTRSLGNGTSAPTILTDIDYIPSLIEHGSFLEQIVAIFTNVLRVDDDHLVRNIEQATLRAAQYIRNYINPAYEIVPPLADWEVELL